MTTKVLIAGAAGRMGIELLRYGLDLHKQNKIHLSGGLVSEHNTAREQDIAVLLGLPDTTGIACRTGLGPHLAKTDVIIDFTAPEYSLQIARECAKHGKAHVCGTTGFTTTELEELTSYASDTAILWSPNMSLTLNLMAQLVQECASKLGEEFDIEILEMHHKYKVDAPSGTAVMLGEAAAKGRDIVLADNATWSRHGQIGKRKEGSIGFATLRGGAVIGEHSVIFASENEHLSITHRAFNRRLYVPGAYRAALWLVEQAPGKLYSIGDVLNS